MYLSPNPAFDSIYLHWINRNHRCSLQTNVRKTHHVCGWIRPRCSCDCLPFSHHDESRTLAWPGWLAGWCLWVYNRKSIRSSIEPIEFVRSPGVCCWIELFRYWRFARGHVSAEWYFVFFLVRFFDKLNQNIFNDAFWIRHSHQPNLGQSPRRWPTKFWPAR